MTSLHVVWPAGVDDPRRPSGGNVYDLELAAALRGQGVAVHEHATLDTVPEGGQVLVDGLVGLDDPTALARERDRLHVLLLVHLPLSLAAPEDPRVAEREARALAGAAGVITTSTWTRRWLLARHRLPSRRVWVAPPGVAPAPRASLELPGERLLCVGPLTHAKGQDVLVEALGSLRRTRWSCRFVGATDLDPGFTAGLRGRLDALGDRVQVVGTLTREQMDAAYDVTDLLVVPSRLETYGMVVTEALARGIPVVAADTGGVPEAMGTSPEGCPGVLVPPADPPPLQVALTRWLADGDHRARLRRAAQARRRTLSPWSTTAAQVRAAFPVNRPGRSAVVTT